jgi:hypothetical protein
MAVPARGAQKSMDLSFNELFVQLTPSNDLIANLFWINPHPTRWRDVQCLERVCSFDEFPLFFLYPSWALISKKPSHHSPPEDLGAEYEWWRKKDEGLQRMSPLQQSFLDESGNLATGIISRIQALNVSATC